MMTAMATNGMAAAMVFRSLSWKSESGTFLLWFSKACIQKKNMGAVKEMMPRGMVSKINKSFSIYFKILLIILGMSSRLGATFIPARLKAFTLES